LLPILDQFWGFSVTRSLLPVIFRICRTAPRFLAPVLNTLNYLENTFIFRQGDYGFVMPQAMPGRLKKIFAA
jgi:hypothetical protein